MLFAAGRSETISIAGNIPSKRVTESRKTDSHSLFLSTIRLEYGVAEPPVRHYGLSTQAP